MDPPPPPPYSEVDTLSTAGSSIPPPILTPASSQTDNASVAARPFPSTASSVDETIYTPLYSPTSSVHKNQVFSDEHDHVSSSSATAFFESRPTHTSHSSAALETIKISVTHGTEPKDIPYPPELQDKDVNELDWLTFVNYLLPDHTAGVNNDVADRKLRAELVDERMHRLTLGKESRSMTDLREVEAQLDPLRQPQTVPSADISRRVEATISEWNEGFFMPRGLQILNTGVEAEESPADGEATPLPGSWIPWEHEMNGEAGPSSNSRKGFFSGFMQAGPQGFKMGPIVADNDGFRIGRNGLRADTNGFRLGNMLVANSNGFRLGGSRGLNADVNGVSLGGRSWGRRESNDPERGRGGRHKNHRGRSHSHGRRRRRRGGRSASVSSTSSSSSSSSSDSDSSVGSLPEYEDLKDGQLPIVKQSLMEWLSNSDQPITKASVRDLKEDINYAKDNVPQQKGQELSTLRKEVRDLTKLFKDAKRAQKRERREARRERKVARKAERKKRRALKREERQSKREDKRCGPRGARTGPPWMSRANMMPGSFFPTSPNVVPDADSPSMAPPIPFGPSLPRGPGHLFHSEHPGFPFTRSASAPFMTGLPFGRGAENSPPGPTAIHNGWPFTHNTSYTHGVPISPTPAPDSAERLHSQALQMEKAAELKESQAIDLRTAATGRSVSEKEKLKMRDQATGLEEEAEKYRREVERLRAEALHLDGEMARELQEDGGRDGNRQEQGIIPGAYVN
ncbi:hypothetical protein VTL71DRAFT_11041 [Oculimacula yallundae]|uniref:Uncharacterized protein n=1 Tax=Oculimacula yallundae TaxID=86028 RepID=A0ABR4CUT7_9HELO